MATMRWFRRNEAPAEAAAAPASPPPVASRMVESMRQAGDVEELIRVVREKLGGVEAREAATVALGELGDARAVTPLIEQLQPYVRGIGTVLAQARQEPRPLDLDRTLAAAAIGAGLAVKTVEALRRVGGPEADLATASVARDEGLHRGVASMELVGATTAEEARLLALIESARKLLVAAGTSADSLAQPSLAPVPQPVSLQPAPPSPAEPEPSPTPEPDSPTASEPEPAPPPEPQPVPAPEPAPSELSPGAAVLLRITEGLINRVAPCRRCGTVIRYEDGYRLAHDRGIREHVVMCPTCNSVYSARLGAGGLELLDDCTFLFEP
jgi:hypothetical protein